jgi:hypothetical protein
MKECLCNNFEVCCNSKNANLMGHKCVKAMITKVMKVQFVKFLFLGPTPTRQVLLHWIQLVEVLLYYNQFHNR